MARRQVFDLPPMTVRVVEHQLIAGRCGCGRTSCGTAPEGVTAPAASPWCWSRQPADRGSPSPARSKSAPGAEWSFHGEKIDVKYTADYYFWMAAKPGP
jgi:hypothetical protein